MQRYSQDGLERLRKAGSDNAHKGKAARVAVLRAQVESRRVWRDPGSDPLATLPEPKDKRTLAYRLWKARQQPST